MSKAPATPVTDPDPHIAVAQWFDLMGRFCAAVDYDATQALFADDVFSFGTKATIVSGLAHLRRQQWEGIWGNISDFRFALEQLHTGGDTAHAWGIAPWSSTGYHADGEPFDRPGRATAILQRRSGIWLAVHTHFSLAPGTPAHTYGKHR